MQLRASAHHEARGLLPTRGWTRGWTLQDDARDQMKFLTWNLSLHA